MTTMILDIPNRNDGANIRKLRILMGHENQKAFAELCRWSQQKMSKIERQKVVDHVDLVIIADVLGISVEKIINYHNENTIYNVQRNKSYDSSTHNSHLNVDSTVVTNEIPQEIIETMAELKTVVGELAAEVKRLAMVIARLEKGRNG